MGKLERIEAAMASFLIFRAFALGPGLRRRNIAVEDPLDFVQGLDEITSFGFGNPVPDSHPVHRKDSQQQLESGDPAE